MEYFKGEENVYLCAINFNDNKYLINGKIKFDFYSMVKLFKNV